jgi:hypothetical protein
MLHAEPNKHYDVYPSWAEYIVKWHELPKLLADPLASGLLDANDRNDRWSSGRRRHYHNG